MTSSAVAPFQVRRIAFEYEERLGTFKERPVVVGAVAQDRALVLLVKVTGHGPRPEFPGEVRLRDWEAAGLLKPSTVRCSKTVSVPLEDVEPTELIGALSMEDEEAVRRGLFEAGKIECP